ncbi:MAG: MBL fold metallo-hydrolase [Deltaproteobacteria bacterium]|nr:MBL fold metallo-hydrolase [Deltaproteobacteria bacterium]
MYIKQFKYGADNLSYLIYGENSVLAIDGGAVEAILDFIGSAGLELQYITNTHAHPDHTSGNRGLLEKSDARILDHVGTCFSGDLKAFYRSIQHLVELPGDTVVYAGHDYLEYAMAFARLVEPDNPDIDGYLAGYTPEHVFSRLEDELKVNPFLRYNHPEMIAILEERGSATASEYQRFESVMHLE